jgi:hypothetical protein
VIEKPELLFRNSIFEIRSFTLTLYAIAGFKRGQGKSSFVGSVLRLSNRFYEAVVQNLKAWVPPAPKVKPESVEQTDGNTSNDDLPITQIHTVDLNDDSNESESLAGLEGILSSRNPV